MKNLIVHLSLIENIGPAAINKVFNNLSLDQIKDLYSFTQSDLISLCSLTAPTAAKIVLGLANQRLLEHELLLVQKHGITVHTIFDDEYPALLKQIYLPPPVLYIKGHFKESKSLAGVGSRQAHSYAQRVLALLLPPIIDNGWSIVSGGALGADTFAHHIALKTGGITSAVLGSGLLQLYPSENRKFFDEIVHHGGALISPFALNHCPLPGNFPARNRIIAGLSHGCLVVQAAQKSGARITANYALEQGKEVFVVPGPIDDPLSAGGHALIQQGAKLVTTSEDILIEFNETSTIAPLQIRSKFEQQVSLLKVSEQEPQDPFVALCKQPISAEELADKTNLSLPELQAKLFDLQLDGKIAQNFAGLWESI
jgi:DNA processing protein